MTKNPKSVTTKRENQKRLHIYLTGFVKEFHEQMRTTYPNRTDSQIVGMLQRAGSPASKALDAVETAIHIYSGDLPDVVADGLHMAVVRARRAIAGLEAPNTLQTVLVLDRSAEDLMDEVMRA